MVVDKVVRVRGHIRKKSDEPKVFRKYFRESLSGWDCTVEVDLNRKKITISYEFSVYPYAVERKKIVVTTKEVYTTRYVDSYIPGSKSEIKPKYVLKKIDESTFNKIAKGVIDGIRKLEKLGVKEYNSLVGKYIVTPVEKAIGMWIIFP